MGKIKFDDIIPISARAILVVEEGEVELIISGYKFVFTIQEYSNKIIKILLDSDKPKARKLLAPFGVTFNKDTLDEVHGDEFIKYIREIYSLSNSNGGMSCSWIEDDYDDFVYKEF